MSDINIKALSVYFNDICALDHLSLTLERGKKYTIIGPSGCGKSTLISALASLLPSDIHKEGEIDNPYVHTTEVVFQDYGLLPWKTALENIKLPFILNSELKMSPHLFNQVIERFRINRFQYQYPKTLSGGQKQRVALARAWLTDAELLLLDEPFSALDAITRETIQYDLKTLLLENQKTMLLVTHSIEEAVYLGESILLMGSNGKLLTVFDNWSYPILDARSHQSYYEMCQLLRKKLAEVLNDENQ